MYRFIVVYLDSSSIKSRDINSRSKKSIVILDDSMLKYLSGLEMLKKVNNNRKIFVKHFSGAATSCLKVYIKSYLQELYNPSCGNDRLNHRQDFARHCNLDSEHSLFRERQKM